MVAVDGPGTSGKAIDTALNLAEVNHAQLVVAHVSPVFLPIMPPFGFGVPLTLSDHISEMEAEDKKRASRWLARLVDIAEERGIDATKALIIGQASVAEEIIHRAAEEGADLIVVGTHRRGTLEKFILGSTSGALLNQANCPVLIVN